MENLISLKSVIENETLLKKRIFTEIQLNTLKKKLKNQKLTTTEKAYYYKYIKPKINAMFSLLNISKFNIQGKENIIQARIPTAINIIKNISKKHKNKKIMISGSFLFSKDYNDIDVFIFSKYNKEDYTDGKAHINFLPESALNSLFFSSLSGISISNFSYETKNEFNISLKKIMQSYELLVNCILNKEDYQKELRNFVLESEYVSKKIVLNPKQLYELKKIIEKKGVIKTASIQFINSLILGYSRNILLKLKKYISDYSLLLKRYKNAENINIYINTYKKVISFA